MWIALSVIAGIALVLYFRGQNPVWGGLTLGAIGGLIAALITGFEWSTVGKWAVVGALLGLLLELSGKLFRKRN